MKRVTAVIAAVLISMCANAYACPEIYGIPDFNCDGMLQITVIGDSLVVGFGDTKYKNRGGYVLRLEKKLKEASVTNLGKLGMRSGVLQSYLKDTFTKGKNKSAKAILLVSDIVILDLGRNDRWLFGEPAATYKNLKAAQKYLVTEVTKSEGTAPIVVLAVEMLPNRGSQGPWVKELNKLVLKGNSSTYPSDLRFDQVSKRLLGSDQVHPTSKGYDALYSTLYKYLKGTLAKKMRKLRVDTDLDGVPDALETGKYGTDPALADTDGDTKSDGDEIFTLNTNPLVAD